jgi:hypothetical protein
MATNLNDEMFAKFIDEKSDEYLRQLDGVSAQTVGEFLAPLIRFYLEREQDRR